MTRHHGMFHFAQAIIMQGRYNSVESYGGKNRAKYVWKHRTDCRKENRICSSADTKARTSISVEPTSYCQQISSTTYTVSTYASCKWAKEQNSKDINASLYKSIAKMHELLLNFPYRNGKVEMSTIRSSKLWCPDYYIFWNCKTPNLSTR